MRKMLMIACLLSFATMCGCRTASTPEDKAEQLRKITADRGKVQLWEGGPYWADRNIGADKPEDYGLYFWWGDTTGHRPSGTTFGFSFKSSNCPTYNKSVSELQGEGRITSEGVLAPSHDAAHVHWGGNWRMPTYQELSDLNSKCDWEWTTTNGVNGYIVRGRGAYASNSIFFPAAGFGGGTSLHHAGSFGFYWSSVPLSDYSYYAYVLYFYSSGHHISYYHFCTRVTGRSVRPVQGFTN